MTQEIVEDKIGKGKNYRSVYYVYAGSKYICRYSCLESAEKAFPKATVTLLESYPTDAERAWQMGEHE